MEQEPFDVRLAMARFRCQAENKPFYFNLVEEMADFTAEICLRYPMVYVCALAVRNKLNRCNFFAQIVFSCGISRHTKRSLLLTYRELKR